MSAPPRAWVDELEFGAPDVVAVWRLIDPADFSKDYSATRAELSQRAGAGSAPRVLAEQEAIADALEAILAEMPDELLRAPGGEADWNVAQAFAHTTGSRRYLAAAAAMAARGEWPDPPPVVTPGIPGPADADRETLLILLGKSRRSMTLSTTAISGHETDPCPLDHPLIGTRLLCGEWLLFCGVHDLMHLEQLHGLLDRATE
ncbi:MAG TPA: DinB family protein [Pleomorphomonadaceae bacterium]|nr:DinB family protein [Pleomorphomonadaceae bacterium]